MKIHRFTDGAVPVNAYLVETAAALVAVDATLTVSGGRGLRAHADELGKPLAGVLVTHAHPDHYGGLVELLRGEDLPVAATAGVADVIARDDPVKEEILRPMFGAEWPRERRFPNRTVADRQTVELGGASFTVIDLGPGESPHDSVWLLDDVDSPVFAGDQAYNGMHAYLADGFYERWLAHIARLRDELPESATLYVGHGGPGGLQLLGQQAYYIETFAGALEEALLLHLAKRLGEHLLRDALDHPTEVRMTLGPAPPTRTGREPSTCRRRARAHVWMRSSD